MLLIINALYFIITFCIGNRGLCHGNGACMGSIDIRKLLFI